MDLLTPIDALTHARIMTDFHLVIKYVATRYISKPTDCTIRFYVENGSKDNIRGSVGVWLLVEMALYY